MPGPTPWLLVGCLGPASRWATDAIQLTGRGRPEGAPWPGLPADLPVDPAPGRAQRGRPADRAGRARARATWTTGFFAVFRADHPAATSADDARHATAALADPAAVLPAG